jgi:prepilin-type N-terminal cleavage/methylation domain-containing protein
MNRRSPNAPSPRAFTLIELLVTIALIALLLGLMAPSLARARDTARTAACLSNLRQMAAGWMLYAHDFHDRAMPLAYWSNADKGAGPVVYWWGASGKDFVDHDRGFLTPYLAASHGPRSVYECPVQPWGSYKPQGKHSKPTSTYGYNGYYLSPSKTPGWGFEIGFRPWRRVSDIARPSDLLVFADTMLPTDTPQNNALLDPPMLYGASGWYENESPTTSFRHSRQQELLGNCVNSRADGSVHSVRSAPQWIKYSKNIIGSLGETNDPWYVPDWKSWMTNAN